MDLSSPKSPIQDPSDTFIDTIKSSPHSSSHIDSSPSSGFQQNPEDTLINYSTTIIDQETLSFLKKHFSGVQKGSLGIEAFLDTVLQEFFFRNSCRTSEIEDTIEFRRALRGLLRKNLASENPEVLSLGQLNRHTQGKGLYNFVAELAGEVKNAEKLKVATQVSGGVKDNSEISMKREELIVWESRLREYEYSLNQRESQIKSVLQMEYERLMKEFDENYKDRVNNMQKRITNHEKGVKVKVSKLESQVKEIKTQGAGGPGSQDKLRIKVSTLEKNNEFLKLRVQELEKRIGEEQEARQSVMQKNKSLMSKVSMLEKGGQEGKSDPSSIGQIEEGKGEEKGSDVNREEGDKDESQERGQSLSLEDEEKDEVKGKKAKGGTVVETPMTLKKKTVASKTIVSSASEFKVLLNVVHSLVLCLKSTIPTYVQTGLGKEGKAGKENIRVREENKKGETGLDEEKMALDLGEVFYPCFDSLIANLTELMPIIGKPYDVKYISSIMEIYYKLLNFFFKFKVQRKFADKDENRFLSEFDIQNSMDKIKTSQDHINEIMTPAQTAKSSLDVIFMPQTEYWKKIVKITKPVTKSKSIIDHPNPLLRPSFTRDPKDKGGSDKSSNYIRLFAEEIVQKELLMVIKKFLDSTEFMLKSNEKDPNANNNMVSVVTFHTKLNLETQKYLQMTRLYAALIVVLLAKTKKDQLIGLQAILFDLNVDNVKIAEFLRLFFVENDGINILFWLLQNYPEDFDVIQQIVEVLSSVNYSGAHYKMFGETIRKEGNIKALLDTMLKYQGDSEFCQKICSVVQKATEKTAIYGKSIIPEKYIKLLKNKLNDLEASQTSDPITNNIRSILSNLNEI